MKYKKLLIGLIILIGSFLIILPFLLKGNADQDLRVGGSLISALASMTTMIIALLLFDKYGLKKSRIEKQSEITIQFLSLIKDLSFWMHSSRSFLQYKPGSNQESIYELVYSTKLFFDDTYIGAISEISDYGYDINMPRTIADKIKVLKPYSMIPIEKDDVPDDGFIVSMHPLSKSRIIEKVFSKINERELTLFEYHTSWTDIIDSAKDWLSKNNIDINDLNIN